MQIPPVIQSLFREYVKEIWSRKTSTDHKGFGHRMKILDIGCGAKVAVKGSEK